MQQNASLSAISKQIEAVVNGLNDAFNRKDVDGIMAAMTDDCVFESTSPPPDGARFQGQAAVRALWEDFSSRRPTPTLKPRICSWRKTGAPYCGDTVGPAVMGKRGSSEGLISLL